MPPFLPRKRLNSTPPQSPHEPSPPTKRRRVGDTDRRDRSTLEGNREFTLGSDSDSSLSDADSEDLEEFEDVEHNITAPKAKPHEEPDDEEDIDWEDAVPQEGAKPSNPFSEMPGGDIQLNLSKDYDDGDTYGSLTAALGAKKGPSKIERRIRIQTHCMHVQFLMFHNAIRNTWIGKKEVQDILVKQLPSVLRDEIDRWRVAAGLDSAPAPDPPKKVNPGRKDKSKKRGRKSEKDVRNNRDWSERSEPLENKSRPDLLPPLLKALALYWKQKFTITAPGLRKQGYRSRAQLRKHIASFNEKHEPSKHGEMVKDLEEFKELARRRQGSRDVGAQLFTALLRGIGVEARMVANLQPIGFSWNKAEEALPPQADGQSEAKSPSIKGGTGEERSRKTPNVKAKSEPALAGSKDKQPSKRNGAVADRPIDLNSDEDDDDMLDSEDDNDSVVEIASKKSVRPNFRRFDKDLLFPIYWTETISPATNKPIPISPFIGAKSVAITDEDLAAFEPRGAKADKAKQVMAYVIAFSPDGSAKDVTTRYLKKHMWPGRTKGFRIPVEKVPIYNIRGKVKRHEDFDWFKTVISPYARPHGKRTAVDDLEESTDLVPQQPEKKKADQGVDTLQSLRSSADFCLERFLRREEALKPGAKPDRTFKSGKGENAKEENVYLRKDVVRCLSAESWHKEGRQPKFGETPLKLVPIRAVTLTRKREIEEQERQTGEKPTQGLYSREQTEYIIPPPIEDGIIPKNAYGNIDCFVPSMVPKGAVHVPLRGTVRICKQLGIDYAEAVTGFEFGNKMAVPVITGVVIASENEHALIDAWEAYEAQQRIKEEAKQQKGILAMWRKMIMGLRINERMRDEYGDAFQSKPNPTNIVDLTSDKEELDLAMPDAVHDNDAGSVGGGGFLLSDEEDHDQVQDELVVENNEQDALRRHTAADMSYPTPASTDSVQQGKNATTESSNTTDLSEVEFNSDDPDNDELVMARLLKQRRGGKSVQTRASRRNSSRPLTDGAHDDTDSEQSGKEESKPDLDDDDGDAGLSSSPDVYTPKPTRTRGRGRPKKGTGKVAEVALNPSTPKTKKKQAKQATIPKRRSGRKGRAKKLDSGDDDEKDEEVVQVTSPYF